MVLDRPTSGMDSSQEIDRRHVLLAVDAAQENGPNIGHSGSNLTICLLSSDEADTETALLSIRDHIANFAGEVLVAERACDGRSGRLKVVFEQLPYRVRLTQLPDEVNYTHILNSDLGNITTEWVMLLAGGVNLLSNPLPTFQEELGALGCKFMSLPVVDADCKTLVSDGRHLEVSYSDGSFNVRRGIDPSSARARSGSIGAVLTTFLSGSACIFDLAAFRALGGYDENLTGGLEDFDLSIRLFQHGYKVCISATIAFVVSHREVGPNQDYFGLQANVDFAKVNEYFERKHGFKVRLSSAEADRGLFAASSKMGLRAREMTPSILRRKPRIALIIDIDEWAFGNISRQLQRHLADEFDFIIIPIAIIDNLAKILMMAKDCELIHFFWREVPLIIGSPYFLSYIESLGLSYLEFERTYIRSKIFTTSIYDHLLLQENELQDRLSLFNDMLGGYTVASEKLAAIYRQVPGYPAPSSVVEDGVDLERFTPKNLERFDSIARRGLIVGWVGNSKWASEVEDFKGVHTILKPAVARLQAEGLPVSMYLADRQERFIPHSRMPDYYTSIDVLICTSQIEGTPNPVLEAMACGVPVISTDVGIVPQAFGDLQKRFILQERSVDALCGLIKEMLAEPALLVKLSYENQQRIQVWDWAFKARKFGDFFASLLATRHG